MLKIRDRAPLSFSECLNSIPGVLVAGSERREDKSKEIKMAVEGDLCKLRNLSPGGYSGFQVTGMIEWA